MNNYQLTYKRKIFLSNKYNKCIAPYLSSHQPLTKYSHKITYINSINKNASASITNIRHQSKKF